MMEPENRIRENVASNTAKEFAQLATLSPLFRKALESMHSGEQQVGSGGTPVAIDDSTRILIEEGMALYSLVVAEQATSTLEVGLGYGFSTVYLLAGLAQIGGGRGRAANS